MLRYTVSHSRVALTICEGQRRKGKTEIFGISLQACLTSVTMFGVTGIRLQNGSVSIGGRNVTVEQRLKRQPRSCELIRGPFLPLSHYSSNSVAASPSDPPPRPTSKAHNHPGVWRMPLQSCIGSPSLLVVNESVSDSSHMSLRFLVFPTHTYNHTAAKLTRLSQRGPERSCFRPQRFSHCSADEGRQGVHQSAACRAEATQSLL